MGDGRKGRERKLHLMGGASRRRLGRSAPPFPPQAESASAGRTSLTLVEEAAICKLQNFVSVKTSGKELFHVKTRRPSEAW